jgi:deoxyribose-phosphate aldolase
LDIEAIVAKVTEEVYARLSSAEQADGAKPTRARMLTGLELAGSLEHSLLNPDTSAEKIKQGCEEAMKFGFANVCVSPYFVSLAKERLGGCNIGICVPVGFPHGAASTKAKCAEIREAILNGATELDVSLQIVAIKSGDFDAAEKDLAEMVSVAGGRAKVKAIYEQGLLTDDEKLRTLSIITKSGVDYVKISNALTSAKACMNDVKFVRSIVGENIGIKIDGGIKDAKTASILLWAGADRLGCSASVQIVTVPAEA